MLPAVTALSAAPRSFGSGALLVMFIFLSFLRFAITRITPNAIVTQDGVSREVDTIIVATGFQVTRYLSAIEVVGRGGKRIDDAWSEGAQAYLALAGEMLNRYEQAA